MPSKLRNALIVANGEKPNKKTVEYLLQKREYTIIAADGGLKNCDKLSLRPDIIIGDFDSAPKSLLKKYSSDALILRQNGQEDTDLEKAMKYLIKEKISTAYFLGIAGGRMDHQLANLSLLIKYKKKLKMTFITNESVLLPVIGKLFCESFPGEIVSVYNFFDEPVSSTGLLYPLAEVKQRFGIADSTSNVSMADSFIIETKSKGCIVVRQVKPLLQYGLL